MILELGIHPTKEEAIATLVSAGFTEVTRYVRVAPLDYSQGPGTVRPTGHNFFVAPAYQRLLSFCRTEPPRGEVPAVALLLSWRGVGRGARLGWLWARPSQRQSFRPEVACGGSVLSPDCRQAMPRLALKA